MKPAYFFVVVIALFAGCGAVTNTPYARFGSDARGGYEDRRLGPTRFWVNFRANAHTLAEKGYGFTLLRASEIAVSEGKKFIVIIDWKRGPFTTAGASHEVYTSTGMMAVGGGPLTFTRSELTFEVVDTVDPSVTRDHILVARDELKRLREKYEIVSN